MKETGEKHSEESSKTKYGKIHFIYGKGKGKTSASVGMAIRALGQNLNVKYVQFMKNGKTGEEKILEKIDGVDYYSGDQSSHVEKEEVVDQEQYDKLLRSFKEVTDVDDRYDIVIADDLLSLIPVSMKKSNVGLNYGDVGEMLEEKSGDTEMVVTGRETTEKLKEKADYISRIKKEKEQEGNVHIIYGKGKGKTSASVGMAIRALGQNLNVKYVQFMKSRSTGEARFLEKLNNLDYHCQDYSSFVNIEEGMNQKQVDFMKKSFEEVSEAEEKYDMVIADELLNVPVFSQNNQDYRLTYRDIRDMLEEKRDDLEIVLTGRHTHNMVKEKADYISRIKNEKHPYNKGLVDRKGIEY